MAPGPCDGVEGTAAPRLHRRPPPARHPGHACLFAAPSAGHPRAPRARWKKKPRNFTIPTGSPDTGRNSAVGPGPSHTKINKGIRCGFWGPHLAGSGRQIGSTPATKIQTISQSVLPRYFGHAAPCARPQFSRAIAHDVHQRCVSRTICPCYCPRGLKFQKTPDSIWFRAGKAPGPEPHPPGPGSRTPGR